MKKIFLAALSFGILFTQATYAECPKGRGFFHDTLALQHPKFRGERLLPYLDECSGLGSLDYSFGSDLAPVTRMLDSHKFSFYRVHFINGPGLRNGLPARYEITSGYNVKSFDQAVRNKNPKILSYLTSRVKLYCDLIPRYPNTKFAFSHTLEHNLSSEAWDILADVTQQACDPKTHNYLLINSPVGGVHFTLTHGAKLETHGESPPLSPAMSSLDGADLTDIDINKWMSKTSGDNKTGIWTRKYNCRTQGAWQYPRERSACPSTDEFEAFAQMTKAPPQSPKLHTTQCTETPFPQSWIWKPAAEDKGKPDPRKNRPVLLSTKKDSSISLLASNGKFVGNLGYYGTYTTPTTFRHYSGCKKSIGCRVDGTGLYGYGYSQEALKVSSSPYIWVKSGKTCYGPILPDRRNGTYYKG